MQVGLVALSLILGRGLTDDEYPTKVPELVGSAWAISAAGDLQPLPAAPARLAVVRAADRSPQRVHVGRAGRRRVRAHAVVHRLRRRPREPGDDSSRAYQEKAGPIAPAPRRCPSARAAGADRLRPCRGPCQPPARRTVAARRVAPCRARPARRGAAAPAAVPRVEATPRVDLPPRPGVHAAAGVRVHRKPRSRRPRGSSPRRSSRRRQPRRGPTTSRFDLTPRTDFSTGFDFAPEAPNEEPDMPQPKSRLAGLQAVERHRRCGRARRAHRRRDDRRAPRMRLAGAGGGDTGTLTVTSNPTGAQVVVDCESKGVTPTTLTLPAGTHTVELRGAASREPSRWPSPPARSCAVRRARERQFVDGPSAGADRPAGRA